LLGFCLVVIEDLAEEEEDDREYELKDVAHYNFELEVFHWKQAIGPCQKVKVESRVQNLAISIEFCLLALGSFVVAVLTHNIIVTIAFGCA